MIREILEKNGFRIYSYVDGYYDVYELFNEEEKYVFETIYTKGNLEEQFARQYVKENGFKLSWLDDCIIKEIDLKRFKYSIAHLIIIDEEKENIKLLCWLYANDIKIINDLEE